MNYFIFRRVCKLYVSNLLFKTPSVFIYKRLRRLFCSYFFDIGRKLPKTLRKEDVKTNLRRLVSLEKNVSTYGFI